MSVKPIRNLLEYLKIVHLGRFDERCEAHLAKAIEEVQNSVDENGKGEPVTLPGIFMVAVPAWIDGEPVRIPARLRYRAGGGTVTWFYDLYRPEFWLRNQVIDDLTRASQETALPAYLGAPEA